MFSLSLSLSLTLSFFSFPLSYIPKNKKFLHSFRVFFFVLPSGLPRCHELSAFPLLVSMVFFGLLLVHRSVRPLFGVVSEEAIARHLSKSVKAHRGHEAGCGGLGETDAFHIFCAKCDHKLPRSRIPDVVHVLCAGRGSLWSHFSAQADLRAAEAKAEQAHKIHVKEAEARLETEYRAKVEAVETTREAVEASCESLRKSITRRSALFNDGRKAQVESVKRALLYFPSFWPVGDILFRT